MSCSACTLMRASRFDLSCDCSKDGTYPSLAPFHLEVTVVPLCLNLSVPAGKHDIHFIPEYGAALLT